MCLCVESCHSSNLEMLRIRKACHVHYAYGFPSPEERTKRRRLTVQNSTGHDPSQVRGVWIAPLLGAKARSRTTNVSWYILGRAPAPSRIQDCGMPEMMTPFARTHRQLLPDTDAGWIAPDGPLPGDFVALKRVS